MSATTRQAILLKIRGKRVYHWHKTGQWSRGGNKFLRAADVQIIQQLISAELVNLVEHTDKFDVYVVSEEVA